MTRDELKQEIRESAHHALNGAYTGVVKTLVAVNLEVMDALPIRLDEVPSQDQWNILSRALARLAATTYPYRRWAPAQRHESWNCPMCRAAAENEDEKR